MANRENTLIEITPEVLLKAYACGIFPMAESADDPALYWIEPDMRGIIPLEGFHLPARLSRTVRATPFTVWVDRDFDAVIDGCAEGKPDRDFPLTANGSHQHQAGQVHASYEQNHANRNKQNAQ